jgi:hypothetical protein
MASSTKSIMVGKKTKIPMDYRLMKKGGNWTVYDVVIDGVSLIQNYRGQFTAILRSSSYEHLVQVLREKITQYNVKTKSADTARHLAKQHSARLALQPPSATLSSGHERDPLPSASPQLSVGQTDLRGYLFNSGARSARNSSTATVISDDGREVHSTPRSNHRSSSTQ